MLKKIISIIILIIIILLILFAISPIFVPKWIYEGDNYIGGNPWIVSTLWMGLYYAEIGDIQRCKEKLVWATKHATNLGFLPEQVDKFNGKPAWIMQLSWSSAMYIVALNAIRGYSKEGD